MHRRIILAFSRIGLKYFPNVFSSLKREIAQSSLTMVSETYVGKTLFYSFLAFILVLFYLSAAMVVMGFPIVFSIATSLAISVISSLLVFAIFYTYPLNILKSRKRSIEANLPFAINHLSATAASGVPPHVMFKMLTDVKEYGAIASEANAIIHNVEVFGMDLTSAISEVAKRTPSKEFKQFLNGIVSTITVGGDLRKYLEDSAREALADYRLKREKYLTALSTYADFYTAVLIAAPLFFISILSLMAIIGGTLFGMSIPMAMNIGIYVLIPLLNIIFILFIHFTQPSI